MSNRILKSVQMIYSQLGRLHSTIQEINKDIYVDLQSCLTTQVENLHGVGHFKDKFPTVLNFARNLGNSAYESIKMITTWAAIILPIPLSGSRNYHCIKEIPNFPILVKQGAWIRMNRKSWGNGQSSMAKVFVSALSGKRPPSSKLAPYLWICTVHRL